MVEGFHFVIPPIRSQSATMRHLFCRKCASQQLYLLQTADRSFGTTVCLLLHLHLAGHIFFPAHNIVCDPLVFSVGLVCKLAWSWRCKERKELQPTGYEVQVPHNWPIHLVETKVLLSGNQILIQDFCFNYSGSVKGWCIRVEHGRIGSGI